MLPVRTPVRSLAVVVARCRWKQALGLVLATTCFSSSAPAQTPSAEELFKSGVADMKTGRFETGCPAIAESYRLEPLPGALFTLAECEAGWGKTATAIARYEKFLKLYDTLPAAAQSKHEKRRQVALQRSTELRAEVPNITIVMPPDAPPGVEVSLDGEPVPASSFGLGVPLDPGAHIVVVQIPNRPKREHRIVLAKRESFRFTVEIAAAKTPATQQSTHSPQGSPLQSDAPSPSGGKTAAYVLGGVGLVSLGVGTVTGILTLGKKSTIEDRCVDHVCDLEGKDAADSGQTLGLVSTIGFGVGVVGVAAATVLLLTAKPSPTKSGRRWEPVVVSDGRGGTVGVGGRW